MPAGRRPSTRTALALTLTLALVGMAVTTGCAGVDLGGAADAVGLGQAESATLNAAVVSEAPDDTTVHAAGERLENASELPLAERAVASEDGYANETVRGERLAAVGETLDRLPFDRDAGAYYLRYEGEVLRISKPSFRGD